MNPQSLVEKLSEEFHDEVPSWTKPDGTVVLGTAATPVWSPCAKFLNDVRAMDQRRGWWNYVDYLIGRYKECFDELPEDGMPLDLMRRRIAYHILRESYRVFGKDFPQKLEERHKKCMSHGEFESQRDIGFCVDLNMLDKYLHAHGLHPNCIKRIMGVRLSELIRWIGRKYPKARIVDIHKVVTKLGASTTHGYVELQAGFGRRPIPRGRIPGIGDANEMAIDLLMEDDNA